MLAVCPSVKEAFLHPGWLAEGVDVPALVLKPFGNHPVSAACALIQHELHEWSLGVRVTPERTMSALIYQFAKQEQRRIRDLGKS